MFRRLLTNAAAALAIGLGVTTAADAAVINFNSDTTYTAATWISEGGMTFSGYELYLIPPDWALANPSTYNSPLTSPILATWLAPMTMSLTSGAAFDLQSIDMGLGWWNLPGGDTETITGTRANCVDDGTGNCTVTQTFNVGYTFQTYALSADFTGLSSVTFGAMTTQVNEYGPYSGWIGYDNINFSSPGEIGEPIPEPAAWSLMILGFGALGGLLRGRRRMTAFRLAA